MRIHAASRGISLSRSVPAWVRVASGVAFSGGGDAGDLGEQTRWTDTVYYTADGSASVADCRNKPQWVDLVCWTGPAVQPSSGGEIPSTQVTNYSAWLAPSRVKEKVAGTFRRDTQTTFDAAGRVTMQAVLTPGVTDVEQPLLYTSYSATTGMVTSVGDEEFDQVTAYDSWGRVMSTTDGYGNTATRTYDAASRVASAGDGKGTVTYGYDGTDVAGKVERRGLVTSVDVGASGVEVKGAYDADGNLVKQVTGGASAGVSTSTVFDVTGFARSSSSSLGGVSSLAFARSANAAGQVRSESQVTGSQEYAYDGRGRLVRVRDRRAVSPGGAVGCFTRSYGFSVDSNRTLLSSFAPDGGGGCQSGTASSTVNRSFDQADRATLAGYAYDVLGRTTVVPAADTVSGAADVSVGYHANDMVRSLSSGGRSQVFDLDPTGRVHGVSSSTGGVELSRVQNHYAGGGDAPAWSSFESRESGSAPWASTWTRYVAGLDGGLGVTVDSDGVVRVQVVNLDGDVVASWDLTGDNAGTVTSFSEASEYGAPAAGTVKPERYGWLGSHQRDTGTAIGDLVLMGVRLYNPATGRFLTRDPVAGGNDNSYVYPADPINKVDLDGRAGTFSWTGWYVQPGRVMFIAVLTKSATRDAGNAGTVIGLHNAYISAMLKQTVDLSSLQGSRLAKAAKGSVRVMMRYIYRSAFFWSLAYVAASARGARFFGKCLVLTSVLQANAPFAFSSTSWTRCRG